MLATSATQDIERMHTQKKNEQHAPQQIIHVLIYCGEKIVHLEQSIKLNAVSHVIVPYNQYKQKWEDTKGAIRSRNSKKDR
jgi:hypothetical protein